MSRFNKTRVNYSAWHRLIIALVFFLTVVFFLTDNVTHIGIFVHDS